MRIRERQFGHARVFDFAGALVGPEASASACQALRTQLHRQPGLVVVNLARVADVDCEALLVLGCAERAFRRAGGALRIAWPDDGRRPLMSRRVRALFDPFDSVEDALTDLRVSMTTHRTRQAVRRWLARLAGGMRRSR
ncbi:MAG: hypothetical protein AB7N65_12415 [Vicinamibacterales bacterium]